ncbi:MAG: glutathione S-transferase [Gammaproteobacteria bacterium]|nr:MAG: glutathione S-transferase [Gammaproteobacteria bacterium]
MLKLYGFPISNYFNMVKLAMLEKGLEFETVVTRPSQEADYLRISPMDKIPCLKVDEGPLSETDAILDFLEDISSEVALFPDDPYQKAKVRELMKSTEIYLELVARRLLGSVFFGETLSEELKSDVIAQLEKGTAALNKLLKFGPYAAGADFTYADIMLYYTVTLWSMATQKTLDINLEDKLPGLGKWLELMDKNPLVQKVNADRDEAFKTVAG